MHTVIVKQKLHCCSGKINLIGYNYYLNFYFILIYFLYVEYVLHLASSKSNLNNSVVKNNNI